MGESNDPYGLKATIRRLYAQNQALARTVEALLERLSIERLRADRVYELAYTQGRRSRGATTERRRHL